MNPNNKAAAIRELLKALGTNTSSKEIIRRLKEDENMEVSPQQVSNVKAALKRGRQQVVVEDLPVSVLRRVKELSDELGSPDIIRRALDELDALKSQPN